MPLLRTCRRREEYVTIWWIGCIIFLVSLSFSLLLQFTVIPMKVQLDGKQFLEFPWRILLVPFPLQLCFCFLFLTGLSAILSLCRRRQASFRLFFLGSFPLSGMFLLYALPQGILDLHWNSSLEWSSLRVLLFAPSILLGTSCLFFTLSTITLLQKLWIHLHVSVAEQQLTEQERPYTTRL